MARQHRTPDGFRRLTPYETMLRDQAKAEQLADLRAAIATRAERVRVLPDPWRVEIDLPCPFSRGRHQTTAIDDGTQWIRFRCRYCFLVAGRNEQALLAGVEPTRRSAVVYPLAAFNKETTK